MRRAGVRRRTPSVRWRAGVPLTVGGGLHPVGAGGFSQAVLDAGSTWTALVPGLVLVGVGTGPVSPATAGAALAAVGPERAGVAGGAVNGSGSSGTRSGSPSSVRC